MNLRSEIKSWFPHVKNRDNNDLVLHMRTGDRLFMKNEFFPLEASFKSHIATGTNIDLNIRESLARIEERMKAIDRRLGRIEDRDDG